MVEIAAEVGLSRSQVYRVLERIGDPARGDVREDDDEDDDLTPEELGRLPQPADAEEYPPPPPWAFVGYEGSEERWITADGRPVNALDRYRWLAYQANEYDDRPR